VYCDETAAVWIMQFSLKYSLSFLSAKFDDNIQRGSPRGGVVFDRLRDVISRQRCEIELC